MQLSPEQESHMSEIIKWSEEPVSSKSPRFKTLTGLAGTGKTTLVSELGKRIPIQVTTLTGKAADVLRKKGFDEALNIHQIMYRLVDSNDGVLKFARISKNDTNDLMVFDEASMVDPNLFDDLLQFHDGKIMFVGDQGQLGPVSDNKEFNIVSESDWNLTQIHRQALDNPIIRLAHAIREGKTSQLPASDLKDGKGYAVNDRDKAAELFQKAVGDNWRETQVIVPTNELRVMVNRGIRESMGRTEAPTNGDKIVFLNNSKENGVFNGQIDFIKYTQGPETLMCEESGRVQVTNDYLNGGSGKYRFGKARYDFGYAMTCHKSQGSEWKNVMIKATKKKTKKSDWVNWAYTAVTRASEFCNISIV
jgi:exodeoxyribonuclease-5